LDFDVPFLFSPWLSCTVNIDIGTCFNIELSKMIKCYIFVFF